MARRYKVLAKAGLDRAVITRATLQALEASRGPALWGFQHAWEYRIERWEHAENKHRLEELNELGTKGWQLADITPVPDGAQWIFQRPVTPRWKYKATTLR
jgi:hypothetical protein